MGNRQRRVGRTAQGSRARCRVGLSVYLDERRFGAKPNVMASTASHKRYLPRPIQINRLTNRARHISGRLLTRVNEVSGIRRRHHRARADKESARCGTPRAVLVPRCPAIELTAVHHFSKADARASCSEEASLTQSAHRKHSMRNQVPEPQTRKANMLYHWRTLLPNSPTVRWPSHRALGEYSTDSGHTATT